MRKFGEHRKKVFKEKWNLPHCVAAIDGRHVRVKAPPHRGSDFFNYKMYPSVVLLALVDANKRFPTVDAELMMETCLPTVILLCV